MKDRYQTIVQLVDWCLCGRCAEMETYTESLCCKETNEISEEYFQGDDYFYEYFAYPIYCLSKIYFCSSEVFSIRKSQQVLQKACIKIVTRATYTYLIHIYIHIYHHVSLKCY